MSEPQNGRGALFAGGLAAIELNLSCPNLQKKVLVAQSAEATASVVRRVKAVAQYPVIAKLSLVDHRLL
jgi:dihydroorotate dehydrogenase